MATPSPFSIAHTSESDTSPDLPHPSEASSSPLIANEDSPANPAEIERRFLTAQQDPAARIAALRELARVPPAAALTTLNRLFPIEHREDVKAAMFTVLGEFDHTKDRDNQLALCTKALAADQPQRIRYISIHTLADLGDSRAHALLIALQKDPDREIRAAATQALHDLRSVSRDF